VRRHADRIVRELFAHFMADPQGMPAEWGAGLAAADAPLQALRVADYIAGMTDNYALAAHRGISGETPDLRIG